MRIHLAGFGAVVALCMVMHPAMAQEVPGWERIENHGMEGHNIGGPEVLSVEDCAAKCDATAGCLGFDYYRNSRQCLANDADGRTAPGALKLNNPVDFYQREMVDTHGRPAPSYNPGRPDWRVSDAYCHDYAKTAVEQNDYNVRNQCGYTGRRWTNAYDGHFNWCKSVAPSRSKYETKYRYDKLVTCQQSGGGSAGAGGSAGNSSGSGSGAGEGSIGTSGICVNGYLGIPSAGISARNRRVLSNHSLASCRAACNGETWCISFELSTKGACHLSDVNRQTPGIKFNRPANFPWTYYEKCGVAAGSARGGDPYNQPWTTAQGRTCFERWVRDTESRLNNNRGSDTYNRAKPFRINQYGLIEFRSGASHFAPDDFQSAGGTRFRWLWKHSREQGQFWYFRNSARDTRDRVQVYEMKYFVRQCMAGRL